MTFPILGGNGAVAGYSIDNSVIFNDGDSPRLSKTFSTSQTNNKIMTFSFWLKRGVLGNNIKLLESYNGSNAGLAIKLTSSNIIEFNLTSGGVTAGQLITNQVFRDVSSYYHLLFVLDTTDATGGERMKMYVNGNEVTSFSTDTNPAQNTVVVWADNSVANYIGSNFNGTGEYLDGYLAEFNFIDGQALSPTDFGEFDTDSGIWKPIQYTGSYGTNGFYLNFSNTTTIGEDSSGNGNDFSATNIDTVCRGITDTPTNNFATFNVLDNYYANSTFAVGNTKLTQQNDAFNTSTMKMSTGKWYWEARLSNTCGYDSIGITQNVATSSGQVLGAVSTAYGMRSDAGQIITNNSGNSYGVSFTSGDIIGVGLDLDNNKLYFSKNGTWMNSADPSAGTGGFSISAGEYFAGFGKNDVATGSAWQCNFGNPTFTISSGNSDGNGYGNFEYAPPSGFLALCTQNLATVLSPTIDDGSQYFNSVLYSGDGTSDQDITGVGFQPDWVWLKARSSAYNHRLYDSTRGALKNLQSNSTSAELTATNGLISFDTDGFSVSQGGDEYNASGQNYVGWSWKANGGTTSSNTDGSITSTVQVNSTAGFSIATYSGTGSAGTVGHGLGVAPKFVMPKCRNVAQGWASWHTGLSGSGYILELNERNAEYNNGTGSYTALPTSSVVNLGTDHSVSGRDYVMYCFADVEGYSKFGKYTGNGSSDGTFIYTGFRPALIITKQINSTEHWMIRDTKINSFNVANKIFYPNLTNAESTTSGTFDILSNGFKARGSDPSVNGSGSNYIYLTFAENPFVSSSGVPVVAR